LTAAEKMWIPLLFGRVTDAICTPLGSGAPPSRSWISALANRYVCVSS